jgi:hypothetical protein
MGILLHMSNGTEQQATRKVVGHEHNYFSPPWLFFNLYNSKINACSKVHGGTGAVGKIRGTWLCSQGELYLHSLLHRVTVSMKEKSQPTWYQTHPHIVSRIICKRSHSSYKIIL